MENDLVRYSRAGDVFHYRWAARRCLKMINPKSFVKKIVIEGSKERQVAGEYVIDVAEYTEGHDPKITYFQLKHTTQKVNQPFTLSDLQDTIEGFAKRFSALLYGNDTTYSLGSVRFAIITNRPFADSFKNGISSIRNGNKAKDLFQKTIEKYTKLQDTKLQEFCTSLDLIDGEGNYVAQRSELHAEMSTFLAGSVENAQVDTLIALIQDKALPNNDGEIVREDILKRFGVASERDLFPAPLELEKSQNFIKREQHEILFNSVLEASTPVIIHAGGGVGKSVFSRQLAESFPTGSLGIVYDCFGAGKYRNRSESRHRHRDALVQIANEIAVHGLCKILIPDSTDLEDAILRAFLSRLKTAATALQQANENAILAILIDAADNAEMAAKEFSESCFAHQLLREQFPEGCRLITLCRTERIDLLKPNSTVQQIELKPFSQAETVVHLREHFPSATDSDGLEFHRLTGGNPRVQAYALSEPHNTVSEVMAGLGPSGTTVDQQITAQLDSAISKVKDELPTDYHQQIEAICLGLANLTPFIPIEVLATAAEVEGSTVKSFVSDLGRPLWISENSVQFRDEPTETWFREKFSASVDQIQSYITRLKPLASKFAYVAQVLPSLLLQSENYDELIDLALSDDYLPEDSPIDERNIRLYRLQFAFRAALKQKRYTDAAKLALRAGEEVAGDQRQLELLTQNVDLIAPLQSPQRVQELAFRRMLRGGWQGSENIYSAALLSSVKEFQGEARSFLRSGRNWLKLYFQERDKNKDEIYNQESLTEHDIVEMAIAHFHLEGTKKLVDFILSWRPPELVFRVTRLLIKRLVDAGDFTVIDEIYQLGCRNLYLMIAISNELIKVGKFPPENAMRVGLDLLAHKRSRISISADAWSEQGQIWYSAIISFAEASLALKLSQSKILRVLNYYLPKTANSFISNHYHGEWDNFLRGNALKFAILGQAFKIRTLAFLNTTQIFGLSLLWVMVVKKKNPFTLEDTEPNIEALIPQRWREDKSRQSSQDIEEFKQVIGGLLPWYLIRSRLLLNPSENLEIAFQEAEQQSNRARAQRYKSYDSLPSEIARVRFEILALSNSNNPLKLHITQEIFSDEYRLLLHHHLSAVRASYRLEYLSEIGNQLEHSCYERIRSISDEGPEEKAKNYIELARAVLPVSPADAAEYFNDAIEAVSKFGDEVTERWNAVVAIAKRSAEGGYSSPEIAYRFIRCAELVGDFVYKEKHWNRDEAIQVCSKLCPSSAFAALSRWRDRHVGYVDCFEDQLFALARETVRSKIIKPSVAWSLSAFFGKEGYDEFAKLCIETESEQTCRQYILDTAVRDIRLNEASESSWQTLKRTAEKFSLENPEIQKVLDFYAQQSEGEKTEELSQLPRITKSKETQNIDYDTIFAGLDLTQPTGLSKALDRFDNLPYPRYPETFWQEVFKRVPQGKARAFLEALVEAEHADFYDIRNALSNFPDSYRQTISVRKFWTKFFELFAQRFAQSFAASLRFYRREYFIRELQADDQVLEAINKGIIKGLSDSSNLLDASTLFGFSEVISSFVSPQEANNLLEFALSRFEIHIEKIDKDYGDGTWDDWLIPPDNILDGFTGLIWSALGSPRSAIRWQAAHCVRRLAEGGCQDEIDALIKWMNRDCIDAFGSHKFPFYNLHARLYLLIALARIAIDSPEKLKQHHSVFADYALNSLPHALIQKFAAEIALSIETAFPETYDSSVVEKLRNVGVSQMPVKKFDGYRNNYEETPWHTRGEVDLHLTFHFGWDFDKYWFKPLANVFGISGNKVEELARQVVIKEWDIAISGNLIQDPRRSSLWYSSSRMLETRHSHGSYPRTDDYSFYISYHAMLTVAAKLLLEMPIVDYGDNWEDDKWADWLGRHTLTRSDGRWLADRRDPAPLERPIWMLEKTTENWRKELKDDNFLDGLLIERNGTTWLNIRSSWINHDNKRQENIHITSALVAPETSQSLLNALSSCLDPGNFKLPDYQEDYMEFRESPFELLGWIYQNIEEYKKLDEADPSASNIDYPPYKIGDSIVNQLELSVDNEQRNWYLPNTTEESLVCQLWSLSTGKNQEEASKGGIRMSASLEFLKLLCATFDCELIIEVQVERRFRKYSSYGRSNNDERYSPPNSKLYILSANGQLRDTRTCYQLR